MRWHRGASSYKALVCVFLFGGNDAQQHTDSVRYDRIWELLDDSRATGDSAEPVAAVERAAELRAESEPAGHSDAVRQQECGVCGECGDTDRADDEGAVPGGYRFADEPVFAPGPAIGVAECGCERIHFDGLGGTDRGHAECQLQPRRFGADGDFGGRRHAVLQWEREHAGECEPRESERRSVLGGNDRVRRATGDGAGAAELRLGIDTGAGGQFDYHQRVLIREGVEQRRCSRCRR